MTAKTMSIKVSCIIYEFVLYNFLLSAYLRKVISIFRDGQTKFFAGFKSFGPSFLVVLNTLISFSLIEAILSLLHLPAQLHLQVQKRNFLDAKTVFTMQDLFMPRKAGNFLKWLILQENFYLVIERTGGGIYLFKTRYLDQWNQNQVFAFLHIPCPCWQVFRSIIPQV